MFSEPAKSGLRKDRTVFRNLKLGLFSPRGFVIPEVLLQPRQLSRRLPGPNTNPGHTPAYRKRSQTIGNLGFDSERQTVVRKHRNPIGNTEYKSEIQTEIVSELRFVMPQARTGTPRTHHASRSPSGIAERGAFRLWRAGNQPFGNRKISQVYTSTKGCLTDFAMIAAFHPPTNDGI